jgi:hypothetical protein
MGRRIGMASLNSDFNEADWTFISIREDNFPRYSFAILIFLNYFVSVYVANYFT